MASPLTIGVRYCKMTHLFHKWILMSIKMIRDSEE